MNEEFTNLTRNGLEFLKSSINELEDGNSKYAVIHFFTALEILLKARLVLEDWTLCVSNKDKATIEAFRRGESNTVGLRDALARLGTLPDGKWDQSETNVLDNLRRRRNQAVHFFHPEHLGTAQKVAVEQLVGWHLLFRRLSSQWKTHFQEFEDEIAALDSAMRKRADFFPEVYKQLEAKIFSEAASRHRTVCNECNQPASLSEGSLVEGLFQMRCRVCESEQLSVFLPCKNKDCGRLVDQLTDRSCTCRGCGDEHQVDCMDTLEYFASSHPELAPIAWCGVCGFTPQQSVIRLDGSCFCLACQTMMDRWHVRHCDSCGSDVTGRVGDQMNPGCIRCHHYLCHEETGEPAPEFLHDLEEWKRRREWIACEYEYGI